MSDVASAADRRRAIAVAGHTGGVDEARRGLDDEDAGVRATALGAAERLGVLDVDRLRLACQDRDPSVRRRAAAIAAQRPEIDLTPLLDDDDDRVVETAAWAAGEQPSPCGRVIDRLIALATDASDPLVRESAVAALGAIGDRRAIPTIVAATGDRPAVRRRAVLALAPFVADGDPAVDTALDRALTDRDWQVRQAAEDLRRPAGDPDGPPQTR